MNNTAAGGIASVAQAVEPGRPAVITAAFLAVWRAFAVVFFSVVALAENVITIPLIARPRRLYARSAWLHRWCRFACRVLGIRVATRGSMPQAGLLVCN